MERGVLASCPIAQQSLSIDLYCVHGDVNKKVGVKGGLCNGNVHILLNFSLCACLAPDAYFVESAVPPFVVVCVSELQIAKLGES